MNINIIIFGIISGLVWGGMCSIFLVNIFGPAGLPLCLTSGLLTGIFMTKISISLLAKFKSYVFHAIISPFILLIIGGAIFGFLYGIGSMLIPNVNIKSELNNWYSPVIFTGFFSLGWLFIIYITYPLAVINMSLAIFVFGKSPMPNKSIHRTAE